MERVEVVVDKRLLVVVVSKGDMEFRVKANDSTESGPIVANNAKADAATPYILLIIRSF